MLLSDLRTIPKKLTPKGGRGGSAQASWERAKWTTRLPSTVPVQPYWLARGAPYATLRRRAAIGRGRAPPLAGAAPRFHAGSQWP